MNKTIYLLNIGDYAPEVTELTYPTIHDYATKIDAEVYVIVDRAFPKWPVTYEKLQIHRLAKKRADDWAIYIDSDTLVHPELPDVTEIIPRDFVCHNAVDFAPVRWRYDEYFRRDGRNIGSANWFAVASSWCLDLWRPLDDLTPEEAEANITLTAPERQHMKPEHLIDDYALSRNIARFGLKVVTLRELWDKAPRTPLPPTAEFFFHEYLLPIHDEPVVDDEGNEVLESVVDENGKLVEVRPQVRQGKVTKMRQTLERWQL